uniref:Uncharacterized protein n=1 Tax=Acrobeloides nanus TaxID=290746 RepID=A0A914DWR7_9BILA
MHPEDKIASRIEPLTNLRQMFNEPLNIKQANADLDCMNRIDFWMKDVIVSSPKSLKTLLCHTIYWKCEELVNFVYEMICRDQSSDIEPSAIESPQVKLRIRVFEQWANLTANNRILQK